MTHVLEVRRKARIELEDRRQLQSELEKWQTPSELETSKKSHLTPPPSLRKTDNLFASIPSNGIHYLNT